MGMAEKPRQSPCVGQKWLELTRSGVVALAELGSFDYQSPRAMVPFTIESLVSMKGSLNSDNNIDSKNILDYYKNKY